MDVDGGKMDGDEEEVENAVGLDLGDPRRFLPFDLESFFLMIFFRAGFWLSCLRMVFFL